MSRQEAVEEEPKKKEPIQFVAAEALARAS